ncbi:MAG TPA: isoprenylcysteine carboxylmethyltransferase family protein [Chloroflexota bacterium]|jgi:protein-S-isoprenylcysteine O-methyltransferase Ste14|nr:isoprenylcysteine carboxylmethyltransferase family protein [Chloroflexota bacterium]
MQTGALVARTWRGLVGVHRGIEATTWGRLLLGNVWPAYLFALPLGVRLWGFLLRLTQRPAQTSVHVLALELQELVTIAFLLLIVALFAIRRPVVGRHAGWRAGLVALAGTFLLNVVGFLPVGSSTSTVVVLVSTAVILLGSLFTIWSLATLGRCFGLLPEVRGLVQRGPYRWVRHPVYLGELTSALGLLIARPHPAIVALYLVFVWLQLWRTQLEEAALMEVFPSEYPAYRERVPRLLPGWPR